MEVETPLLGASTVTDPHLQSIKVPVFRDSPVSGSAGPADYFLQTSPEFAMKRLLASGSGSIYQISKAFRNGESGSRHNPEFTMLEWYRVGFTLQQMMDEVEELLCVIIPGRRFKRCTYRELFLEYINLDPHQTSTAELENTARQRIDTGSMEGTRDDWLNLLLTHCIEPQLEKNSECLFVTDYPASQAALASIEENAQGVLIARRFELYIQAMEVANGYLELLDSGQQRKRFENDQIARHTLGLEINPLDENLLQALEHGLPQCSGVAVGVDRLVMMALGASEISDVITFPIDRA